MSELRKRLPGLASGKAAVFAGLALGIKPPPDLSVADWAEQKRHVGAESGSPFPGKWETSRVPYLAEIMECLSFSHPCREVPFAKSHQVAGTEAGINLFGYVVDQHPATMLIVLPSLDESTKYHRTKLQPTIEATPALRHKVREQKQRDEQGSTTSFKRFRGGFAQITTASSSKGLQMMTVRVLIAEEVSEWPHDVDGRGDPLTLAIRRTTAWQNLGCKRFLVSTPGIAGMCRITARYEASDQRRFYVPCPHDCGIYLTLRWSALKYDETPPYDSHFDCPGCGASIEHRHKRTMIAAGVWLKTYEGDDDNPAPSDWVRAKDLAAWRARPSRGREPGFHLWQAYSPFVTWDEIVRDWLAAKGKPEREKEFTQQVLGEAWEESGEAPDHEKLHERREDFPMRRLPPGALVITGFADVQSNRLEYGVYAWGIGLTGWLIDKGVLEGNPEKPAVWKALDEVLRRTYDDWQGKPWPIEAFGVDTGYLSNQVYYFCRGRERVLACDGRGGHLLPYIGTPSKVDVNHQGKRIAGGCVLWPLGTWQLKAWLYASLRKTLEGPDETGAWQQGALHYPMECDQAYFEQLTAESLVTEESKRGTVRRIWVKARGKPNEALDIAVGARAMAAHLGLDTLDQTGWSRIAAERGAPPELAQRDLAELWAPRPKQQPPAAEAAREKRVAAARKLAQLNG